MESSGTAVENAAFVSLYTLKWLAVAFFTDLSLALTLSICLPVKAPTATKARDKYLLWCSAQPFILITARPQTPSGARSDFPPNSARSSSRLRSPPSSTGNDFPPNSARSSSLLRFLSCTKTAPPPPALFLVVWNSRCTPRQTKVPILTKGS